MLKSLTLISGGKFCVATAIERLLLTALLVSAFFLSASVITATFFDFTGNQGPSLPATTIYPRPTVTGEIKVAGIRIDDEMYIDLFSRLSALVTKVNNLLIAHPDTDLIVTHEFQFYDYVNPQNLRFVCASGECELEYVIPIDYEELSPINGLRETIYELRSIAQEKGVSMVLGTIVETDALGDFVGNTAVVINQEGKIIGGKRKGISTTPTGPLAPFPLVTHHGQNYTMLPVICAERVTKEVIDYEKDFKVDVVAFTAEQGLGLLEHVSEYFSFGTTGMSNAIISAKSYSTSQIFTDLKKQKLYYTDFLEQFVISRDLLKPDGIIVGADKRGAQAGVYNLKNEPLQYLDISNDYVVGISNLPQAGSQTSPAQGLFSRNNMALSAWLNTTSALYFGTYNIDGTKIYKTVDGQNLMKINANINESVNYSATAAVEFNDQVYLAIAKTRSDPNGSGYTSPRGATLWKLSGTNWTQVNQNGFGQNENQRISALATFGSQIFAATYNSTSGTQIWKSSDGANWQQTNANGFGEAGNLETGFLKVFNGCLYAGTFNETGSQVWKSSDGLTWERVANGGFGDAKNILISSASEYDGKLFLGTFNDQGGQIWKSSDGANWQQTNANGFGYPNNSEITVLSGFQGNLFAATLNRQTGTQIWKSSDGANWQQVNSNGFGNDKNLTIVQLQQYQDKLWAATFNPQGLEIWTTADGSSWGKLTPTLKCSDNTVYGQCNAQASQYCSFSGDLSAGSCSKCGCPTGNICQADGTCALKNGCKKVGGQLSCPQAIVPGIY